MTGLPVRIELFLNSFELVLRSAAEANAADLKGLQSGNFGMIQLLTSNTPGHELRVGNSISQTGLFLLLPAGVAGTGDVIRSALTPTGS